MIPARDGIGRRHFGGNLMSTQPAHQSKFAYRCSPPNQATSGSRIFRGRSRASARLSILLPHEDAQFIVQVVVCIAQGSLPVVS
jgi:hypothetical protein